MKFHEKIQELQVKIDETIEQWYQGARKDLNLADLPPSLLSNLMEPSSIVRIQEKQKVIPGYYTSGDGGVQVHVLSQDLSTGLIVMEMMGARVDENSADRYQTMSPGIFSELFKQNDSGTYPKAELLEILHSTEVLSESVQKQQLKEREESFSWEAITTAHGKMAERYGELYESVIKENQEAVKADYLEFLFLAFILGARLGFSPRHDFHALYSGVFALTDNTLEQCKLTMKHYDDQLVETTYEEFRLFDPVMEMAPPITHYIVMSTKDQVGLDKVHYPKGCFMPSQTIISKLMPRA